MKTSCRLHLHATSSHNGGWSSLTSDQNQWLQVKFGQRVEIRRVATQGRQALFHYQWVTSYTLNYSSDGLLFYHYRTNKNQTVGSFTHKPYDSVFPQCLHNLCHSCDTGHYLGEGPMGPGTPLILGSSGSISSRSGSATGLHSA